MLSHISWSFAWIKYKAKWSNASRFQSSDSILQKLIVLQKDTWASAHCRVVFWCWQGGCFLVFCWFGFVVVFLLLVWRFLFWFGFFWWHFFKIWNRRRQVFFFHSWGYPFPEQIYAQQDLDPCRTNYISRNQRCLVPCLIAVNSKMSPRVSRGWVRSYLLINKPHLSFQSYFNTYSYILSLHFIQTQYMTDGFIRYNPDKQHRKS